jgi:fluoride exporter
VIRSAIAVAVGSAVGGVLRFWLTAWVARVLPTALPLGTMLVNILGSLAIGGLAAAFLNRGQSASGLWPALLMTGLLGGFTTFSAFSLHTLMLMQDGRWIVAAGNVVGSVLLCLIAVWVGWQIGVTYQG